MSKTAILTGARSQDSRILAHILLEKDYNVVMTQRHTTIPLEPSLKEANLDGRVTIETMDITDSGAVNNVINKYKPDELYGLAAQSDVRASFDLPQLTFRTNALGTLNLLEAIRTFSPHTKFYNASSSEMFGNNKNEDGFSNEKTALTSRSPYSTSKIAAHHHTLNYRESYGLFACNGILFNHTSTFRGLNFVEMKICDYVGKLFNKKIKDKLKLGNLEAKRDFSHAEDMMLGAYMMLQQDKPDDYTLCSGETHSIREVLEIAFKIANNSPIAFDSELKWEDWVDFDSNLLRPSEVHVLLGDSSKARKVLGWAPTYSFYDIINELVIYCLRGKKRYKIG